jgi:hypothetical protein
MIQRIAAIIRTTRPKTSATIGQLSWTNSPLHSVVFMALILPEGAGSYFWVGVEEVEGCSDRVVTDILFRDVNPY